MKKKPLDEKASRARRADAARNKDVSPAKSIGDVQPAAEPGKATSLRPPKPVEAGLANEARAGLGTRNHDFDPSQKLEEESNGSDAEAKPKATTRAYEEPVPSPREQASDSLEHEQERSTGVSGQSSGG
jgi:hypothetical protein